MKKTLKLLRMTELLFKMKEFTYALFVVCTLVHLYNLHRYAKTGGCTNFPRKEQSPQRNLYRLCRWHFWVSMTFGIAALYLGRNMFIIPDLYTIVHLFYAVGTYIITRNYYSTMDVSEQYPRRHSRPFGIEDVG